uniref:Uncharacterized protein n=1 Tax=Romanomermis culicivorax TaxID=13658 RepID=A0A915IHU4_ROMCU
MPGRPRSASLTTEMSKFSLFVLSQIKIRIHRLSCYDKKLAKNQSEKNLDKLHTNSTADITALSQNEE